MAKLKNPPPKRVRLTKNLGYETRKFLNYLDFRLRIATSMFDFQDIRRTCANDLCALRANWNTWWNEEKRKAGVRKALREVKESRAEWQRRYGRC